MIKISIIIPCRNEKQYIEECVNAIYSNTILPKADIEVLIVDGMSDDGTRDVINSLIPKFANLKLIDNFKQVTPIAFNLGIKEAKGEFIQIIGARHIICGDYLGKSLEILDGKKDVWCVGSQLINEFTTKEGEIISKAMDTPFGMGMGNFRILNESGYTDTVTSPMYPRWVFDKIGLFDEELVRNQDDDFNFRVTQAGGKIWFEHSIFLKYYVRSSYEGLKKQFFQYGYWKVYVNVKHKAVTTLRQLFPPLFVLFAIFSLPVSFMHPILGVLCSFVWGVYIMLAFYFAFKKGSNNTEVIGVLRTFLILHFRYGSGYLKGMFHFMFLGKKPSKKEATLSR